MTFSIYALYASAGPILQDGSISAEWVLGLMAVIVGWFLVDNLKKMRSDMNKLTVQVQEIKEEQIKLRTEYENRTSPEYIEGQNARIAETVYAKIKAITPK